MPFISIQVSGPVSEDQRRETASRLGGLIEILPGKTEKALMLEVTGEHRLFFGGIEKPCAYVDLRLFRKSELSAKKELARCIFQLMKEIFSIEADNVYLSYIELDTWGAHGELKD